MSYCSSCTRIPGEFLVRSSTRSILGRSGERDDLGLDGYDPHNGLLLAVQLRNAVGISEVAFLQVSCSNQSSESTYIK
jgi:hypothetical protein